MRLCFGIFCSFFCALRSKGSTGAALPFFELIVFARARVCAEARDRLVPARRCHPAHSRQVRTSGNGATSPRSGTRTTPLSFLGHEPSLCTFCPHAISAGSCSTKIYRGGRFAVMKLALVLLAGSATAFAPRSVSRPSVAVNGHASSVRTTNRAASPPRSPPDARRGAAGPRAARRDRCGAVKKASVAGCRARPAAAPRAAAQDTPRINESFDTRRLALVAVELAANARPRTTAQHTGTCPTASRPRTGPRARRRRRRPRSRTRPSTRRARPRCRPGVSVRFLLMGSRRTGTPSRRWRPGAVPARRRGDAAHLVRRA